MHFPWDSVVSFLGFGLLLGSDGVLGAALTNSLTTQTTTVPFRISRSPESLPQHHIYVVNASVAGVPFEVILDTGSSDLWIDTSGSEAALSRGEAVKTNRTILLQYGVDGVYTYARGAAEYADVQLGAEMIAYNQSFVNVPGTTNITKYGDKGILGLGPPGGWSVIRETLKGSEWVTNPILRTLLAQNPAMEPFFTVEFSSRDSEGLVNSGTLSFGDASLSFATIRDAPKLHLITGGLWDVPSQRFIVNGEKINFSGSGELPFALDTGAYTACVPPEYMRAIYGSIPGAHLLDDGYWSVPCDAKLNVSMVIGNATFPIHPIDMTEVYGVLEGAPLCKGLFRNNVDKRLPFLIGLNALQNTYALYSYGDRHGNKPYVQLISNIDPKQAAKEFDIMNAARIKSFLERNATLVNQSASLGGTQAATRYRPSPPSTELWSSSLPHLTTSTAPQIGRKRRLSTPEPDDEHEREHTPASKKLRAESEADATPPPATPVPAPETETEVKEVTQGVKEVELEEKPSAAEEVKEKVEEEVSGEEKEAAAVPLPDSPQLKATETEDADADGEADTDPEAEGEVDTKATAEVSSATEGETVEEPPAASTVTDDEVPGLTLASKSPMKKMETMQPAVLTAQA
ncbi:hypothetical protein V8D89_000030 [Ganoderma adspersum]